MPANWIHLRSIVTGRPPPPAFGGATRADEDLYKLSLHARLRARLLLHQNVSHDKGEDSLFSPGKRSLGIPLSPSDSIVSKPESSLPDQMSTEGDSQVCHITESPFRILKMAAQGHLVEVEKLYFADRKRLHVTDSKGWTAIHHAAANDRSAIISFLAQHHADLNQLNNEGDGPLHLAVEHDSINALTQLITCGADVSLKNKDSKTFLHLAVRLNKIPVLDVLLQHKAAINFDSRDEHGLTALHVAAQYDHNQAAEMLIEKQSLVADLCCNYGCYPIHVAAKNASVRVLEVLLRWAEKRGCERRKMLSLPDAEGNAALHLAVHGGDIKAVELCLRNGSNLAWRQHDGSTPVHLACSQGALDIVKLMFQMRLAEKSKVLSMQDAQGMTPLHCSAMFDHSELVSYLLEEEASVEIVDKQQRTCLLLAASQKCWKSVKILLNSGADPSVKDSTKKNILHIIIINRGNINDILSLHQISTLSRLVSLMNEQDILGWSPMHYASKLGQIKSLNSLIQLGASVKIKTQKNESPLHFAARYGRYNTVRQLLDSTNGFLIMNESDHAGKTSLHIASEEGHTRVVQLLMSKGALLHRDHQGRTPLHMAASEGHTNTITALLAVWRHLLDQKDKDGNTPLHMAVKNNRPDTIIHLMNLKCKFLENKAGYKPIDYAIQNKLHEAAIAIVTHERGLVEVIQSVSEIHGCVCVALIRTLPQVFEAALNEAITKANVKESSKDYYVKYAFYPLQLTEEQIAVLASIKKIPKWRPSPLFACNAMVQSSRVDLLMHPLTQKFLQMKWHAYGMYIHLLNMFLYLLFLALVTFFAAGLMPEHPKKVLSNYTSPYLHEEAALNATVNTTQPIPQSLCLYSLIMACGILLFSSLGIVKELFQLKQQRWKYLTNAINLVEWALYITSICMVLPAFHSSIENIPTDQHNYAAITVLTAWLTLLLYFQRFDYIGIYIVMFLEILNTLLIVLAVFSVLIVAFALAFHILLFPGTHLAFSNIPLAMIRTFSMMLGEIDFMNSFIYPFFEDSERYGMTLTFPKTTFVILLAFMILMPILLINLLIGLAVGDIESVKKNAQLKRIAMQVELHTSLENKLPTYIIKRVNKQEIVVYPNEIRKGNFIHRLFEALNFTTFIEPTSKTDGDVQGRFFNDFMVEGISRQQKNLKEMRGHLDQQTKLLRLIMQKMEIHGEGDDTDEGDSNEEMIYMPRLQPGRWKTSAQSVIAQKKSL